MIDSLLPILDSDSDGYESSGSHNPSREVFMANTRDGDASHADLNNLETPIANQTAAQLEATRALILEEQAGLIE